MFVGQHRTFISQQAGARPRGRGDILPSSTNTDYRLSEKMKHFRRWSAFDRLCRVGWWSFSSWFQI